MPALIKLRAAYIALCAFLFVTTSRASYHIMDLQLVNSYTFRSNVNMYTVWLTDTHLHLNSTDKNLKPCNISIDPDKDYTYEALQVKALTNGRKFIVWGAQDESEQYSDTGLGKTETTYTMLVVDPWTCSFKSVPLKYTRDSGHNYQDIYVVTNSDNFDVFLPNQQNCSPCRFDAEGNKVELDYQLELPSPALVPIVSQRRLHIEPLHPTDRNQGYFFSQNFKNDTAVIEHLDQHFKTLKQLYVDHPVHSVSIWPGKHPLLSICYASHNDYVNVSSKQDFEVVCEQLDSDFNPTLSIHLPAIENDFVSGPLHLTHQIDPLGKMYVGFIELNVAEGETNSEDKYKVQQLRYFAYDKTGKLLETYNLNKTDIDPTTKIVSSGIILNLHSFLSIGDKFCLVNDEYRKKIEVKSHEFVTCFDI